MTAATQSDTGLVGVADTEDAWRRCYPVVVQLRPHLTEATFVERVRRQAESGYRLAYVERDGRVRAVAGYRFTEMLSRGRFIYVDDLVTDEVERGHGDGTRLIEWLVARAREQGCDSVELDSGVQRFGAHRFYLRHRFEIVSHHFARRLGG